MNRLHQLATVTTILIGFGFVIAGVVMSNWLVVGVFALIVIAGATAGFVKWPSSDGPAATRSEHME